MSVRFDLTAVAPELLDAVINMDNSPAYEAFKEEIESILKEFNESAHFGSSLTIDEKALTDNSVETMKNMHHAFLLWTIRDELKNGGDAETGYKAYVKLFFKANCDKIAALNGGSMTVAASEAASLIKAFLAEIGKDAELYKSVKEFFKGYIYGYSFNYLTDQEIMEKYAEFLVCLGMMTGKIAASISAQQKIMPKMAMLLGNDRFKYISGFIPLDIMLDIIYDRFCFPNLSDEETEKIHGIIRKYILEHFEMQKDDEATTLISTQVTASLMTDMNGNYVNVPAYSEQTFAGCFGGVRSFLGVDKEDFGEFDAATIAGIINGKCSADFIQYFTTEREPNLEVALGGDDIGYKYPLVFRDASDYWYSPIYQYLINDLLDNKIYSFIDTNNLPLDIFPFADEILKTNAIRTYTNSSATGYSIRADKKQVLIRLIDINSAPSLSDSEKKMLMLEQILYILSGNCDADKYNKLVIDNVFNGELYDEYVMYRINKILEQGSGSVDAKKSLLRQVIAIKL